MEKFEIIGLTETWIEEEIWKKLKDKVSNEYEWFCIEVTKDNRPGRAKGGIIIAVKKEVRKVEVKEISKSSMEVRFENNKKKWRIITLYSRNIKKILEDVMKEIKEEEEYLLIEADFNAWTGNGGGPIGMGEKKKEEGRRSKDKTTNGEGREMLNKLGERGWMILNGSNEKEGGWTYITGI